MKLNVPYVHELLPVDRRLIRLAEFLGITCEPIQLPAMPERFLEVLQSAIPSGKSCLVINPEVIQECIRNETALSGLSTFLVSNVRTLLVHAARPTRFDAHAISALSDGSLQGVIEMTSGLPCEVSGESNNICGPFAGLSISHHKATIRSFAVASTVSDMRRIISIGSGVTLATMKRGNTRLVFVGGEDVADLNDEVGDAPVSSYFLRYLPQAMALRHIFGEESWHPEEHYASVIVDDPLLRPNYGFLNFEKLFDLMKQSRFQTTIAFIPHNCCRNSRQITEMFKENASYFALCFHGNDHMGAELASTDTRLLNTMLHIAERRMDRHLDIAGLECDRVMIFPQGKFSIEAMAVLKARNFDAAVNTVSHPRLQEVRLTFREIAQPAVLRYAGFPLFLRKNSKDTRDADIAFNLFFGRPTFIGEHHDVFQHAKWLVDATSRINAIAPSMHWSSTGNATNRSILRRRAEDGACLVRAYSRTVRLCNEADSTEHFLIEWKDFAPEVSAVLKNGMPCDFLSSQGRIQTSLQLPPYAEGTVALVYENCYPILKKLGFRRNVRAFVRRRLSEIRDNYVSKNSSMAAATKALQRHLVH
jgi:hypothetical protein